MHALEDFLTLVVGIGLLLLLWFLIYRFARFVLTPEQKLYIKWLGGRYQGWGALVGCLFLVCWAAFGFALYWAFACWRLSAIGVSRRHPQGAGH